DILQRRGETEEALRIHREEQLPVYEQIGDIHARAITMGRIADILQQRGETEEALRIRREEELPVYEQIGDIHSRAVTMGQIADILQQRGQAEEALALYSSEVAPQARASGNADLLAWSLFSSARLRAARDDAADDTREVMVDELEESLAIN